MEYSVRNLLIKLLEQGYLPNSAISKSIYPKILQFRDAGFISWEKSGRGSRYVLSDPKSVKKLLDATGYHGSIEGLTSKAKAVSRHGDAHAGKDNSFVIQITVKGEDVIWRKNGYLVDIKTIAEKCGMASIVIRPGDKWETDSPIALVENIDLLVYAKEYFIQNSFQGNILYYAGWAGAKTVNWLKRQQQAPKIIFPDYDFVGLNNYLKLKQIFPGLKLYVPENLSEMIRRFGNKKKFVKQSQKYSLTQGDKDVQMVFSLIQRYGKCLDQESLLLSEDI
jgi:hypothetical protein